ncbi:MAG TPA: cytochrome B [Janthinobacterium sp.]|nr:cytochrome B [Janthinobacterium sp.]
MNDINRSTRYSALAIGMHWLMLLLLVAVYAAMELRGFFPKGGPERAALSHWHFMLGLSVLLLVIVRLTVRLSGQAPSILPPPPRWQRRMAGLLHFALYALMIAMPILGWYLLSAAGKPIPFFGLEVTPLLAKDKALAGQIKEVHETLAAVGYYLIGAHAAAALFHHYVQRDNTLRRMLPFRT